MVDDLEYINFNVDLKADPADSDGTQDQTYGQTGDYEGLELLDFDDLLDRHEVAHLVYMDAHLAVHILQQAQTGNTMARGIHEFNARPSITAAHEAESYSNVATSSGDLTPESSTLTDDSADLPVRPLEAVATQAYRDDGNNQVATGAQGWDAVRGPIPGTWDFDRRDELYLNGVLEMDNWQAGSFHNSIAGQLVFAISEG